MNRRPLNILLFLLCLGFGLGVWGQITAIPTDVSIPRPALAEKDPERVTAETGSLAALGPMADRPLFSPSRRPPEMTALEVEVEAPLPIPSFALSGIVQRGDSRRALLAVDDAAPELVGPGDALAGWSVIDVAENTVTVEQAGRRVTVSMDLRSTAAVSGDPGGAV
ncbi:MAG: hypothetical protein AAF698_09465, partial [Pseudomonadota bacterium]